MNNKVKFLLLVLLTHVINVHAQVNTVKISPKVQKFIGEVSELDRTKYFNIHSKGNDTDFQAFYTDYNVSRLGRAFYGPGAEAKKKAGKVGVYPVSKSAKIEKPKPVTPFILTEHPRNVYQEGMDIEAYSSWAVEYFKNCDVAHRPLWYEPMNEPFVHARDFYEEKDWDPVAEARVKTEMATLYKSLGEKIHADPALKNMKVIGYASAWPSFELKDFTNWHQNMKMFLDIAGDHIDAIAYHLYDGVNQAGQDNKRSGSNNEAIMDMVETYSIIKWGKIKPHAITEYGGIADKEFSMIKNMQSIRSQNAMIFGLFDRENNLDVSIPFTDGKATWHITKGNNFLPYKAVLWKPEKIGVPKKYIVKWVYTDRIHFYSLWKDVKGKRVLTSTDNPDIQVQAFVDGKKMYVALNNLDSNPQKVKLQGLGMGLKIKKVRKKSLTVYKEKRALYKDDILSEVPKELTLGFGETVVLEYSLKKNVSFDKQIQAKRYYSTNYLQPIKADKTFNFEFDKVELGEGFASLSMSIGRKHNVSKSPVVKVNGVQVEVPSNWEGYDQSNRKDFFGTIEIPVPMELVKETNKVSITFPDNGGHLSTLIMNVSIFADTADL